MRSPVQSRVPLHRKRGRVKTHRHALFLFTSTLTQPCLPQQQDPTLHFTQKKERTDKHPSLPLALSDSNRIQTYNLLIRSQMLYSVELWSHCFLNCDAKVGFFFESTNTFAFFLQKKLHLPLTPPLFPQSSLLHRARHLLIVR